jgi:hypothetical protein
MKLEIFTLCDAATEVAGKLNILGSFDHIWTKETPVNYPLCAVAAKVRFWKVEEGNHRIRLNFADEDGKLVMPSIDASVAVRTGVDEPSATANLILHIQQLKLQNYGEYTMDLAIDGRQEGSVPLYVRELKDKTPPV